MRFGAHISIEGGIFRSPLRAAEMGCECFQIFSRSPHGGPTPSLSAEDIRSFQSNLKKGNLEDCFIHAPYYINFASENNRIYYGSIGSIRSEMERADLLGVRGVVTHLGSSRDLGADAGGKKLIEGLVKVFELPSAAAESKPGYLKYQAKLLLEITAGSGNIMGDTFEEIAYFIREAEKSLGGGTLGVCFDTAHAFASGYDLRTPAAVRKTFRKFDQVVGLERIRLVHLNDSAADIDSHTDRHANLGEGKIGLAGITAILTELKQYDLDFVLETPPLHVGKDLEILREARETLQKGLEKKGE